MHSFNIRRVYETPALRSISRLSNEDDENVNRIMREINDQSHGTNTRTRGGRLVRETLLDMALVLIHFLLPLMTRNRINT